ncbi:MAG: trigger factor [Candidatus Omnitrophica bacterium]|nr:trigger factor [Candidatus Omnitrophota bacterium]
MKSKVKKLKGTAREIKVEIPRDTVDAMFDSVLTDIKSSVNIPGFRRGKAPMDIVRKNYGAEAMDKVKERLIPAAYQQALDEHSISPVSFPEVADVNLALSGELTFTATVDTQPEVGLKKYKGIKVSTEKVKVTDDEVSKAIDHLRAQHAEFIEADRPVEKGDFAVCDVETFMDGSVISGKRENMWVEADEEASLLGMGKELIGMKKGETKEIDVTLPGNYPDKKYAGKKAVFKTVVKDVKEKKLPEADAELAAKFGKKDMEEVRGEIRSQLLERKEANARIGMKNQIMEQLLKKHPVEAPGTMVDRQLKVLMEKAENELLQKGVGKEAIGAHKDKLEKQLRVEAENKVKLYFILEGIAEKEKISVSEEDVDGWLGNLSAAYNKDFEEIKKYYEEHDLIAGLREQLREEKTLDFLLDEAVISEK